MCIEALSMLGAKKVRKYDTIRWYNPLSGILNQNLHQQAMRVAPANAAYLGLFTEHDYHLGASLCF
jgi:hypothetical protein